MRGLAAVAQARPGRVVLLAGALLLALPGFAQQATPGARRIATPVVPLPPDRPASVPSVNAPPPSPPVENSYLDGPLLYQLMLAEFDRSDGQPGDAIELVLEAARHNKDDALFRRALEIAVEAGASDKAIAITKSWRQSMPRSTEAARTQVQLDFALDRVSEAGEPLRQLLAMSSASERSALIAGLPRAAQRAQDKAKAAEEFREVLEPYLDQPDTRTAARVALARMRLAEGRTDEALALVGTAQSQDPKALGPVLVALDVLNRSTAAAPAAPVTAATPSAPGSAPAPAPAPAASQAMADQKTAEDLVRAYLSDPQAEPLIRQAYASVLVSQQRLTDAAGQLRLALQGRPKQAQLWLGLGEIELELRHPDEAEDALKHALALVGEQPAAAGDAAQEAPPDATDAAGPTDEADPMNGPVRAAQVQLLLARAAEMRHDDATAAEWLSRVDEKDADLQVVALRASILARQGKLAEARAMIHAAPAKTAAEQRYRLLSEVQLLLDNKKYDDARALLAKANGDAPDDVDLLYQQAMVDEKLDKLDEMERLLRHVLKMQPNNSQALNALGYSLADRNMRLDEALHYVQQAHALAPSDPFIVDSLGWVLYRLGRYDEATGFLGQAYASRKDTEIAAHLGEALWAEGKHDEAVEVLRDAHRRDAGNDVLRQTMTRLKVTP
jgi:tetratricopeptide (TPR) repeat protein